MTRHVLVLLAPLVGLSAAPVPADVRIGVFGLFHPRSLVVSAGTSVLSLRGERQSCVLREGEEARVDVHAGTLRVTCADGSFSTSAIRVIGATGRAADFHLSVPGRITRRFHGRLDVVAAGDEVIPVVSMELETAVASVVAAEQIASTPPEALKAQAVAARSFFVAAHRHRPCPERRCSTSSRRDFDFCDTTHCQFLREPPALDHPAARAARDTAGLVLAFRGAPIPAFYSADCGGRTLTLAEAGLQADDGYPYFSVACVHRHPAGERSGHGIGLCQQGAASLAQGGASFAEILRHYYPATTLEQRAY